MPMEGSFLRIAQHVINANSIDRVNLNFMRSQSEGGGNVYRVWLRQGNGEPETQRPEHLDIEGAEAKGRFRELLGTLESAGQLTIITKSAGGTTEEAEPASAARAKTKKAGG